MGSIIGVCVLIFKFFFFEGEPALLWFNYLICNYQLNLKERGLSRTLFNSMKEAHRPAPLRAPAPQPRQHGAAPGERGLTERALLGKEIK